MSTSFSFFLLIYDYKSTERSWDVSNPKTHSHELVRVAITVSIAYVYNYMYIYVCEQCVLTHRVLVLQKDLCCVRAIH